MREIKFRYYDTQYREMCYSWEDFIGFFEDYAGTEYPIMQYTGLKDKNGVEIYEGDIFTHSEKKKHDSRLINNGVCKYVDGSFFLDTLCGSCYFCRECVVKDINIEVIGNIYENPELLKGVDND